MAIAFPNSARSYDEAAQRVRFLGHDGMFEIRFLLDIDVLANGSSPSRASESDYLDAFDRLRTKILDVAKRVYTSRRKNPIILKLADFR
ncbi:MAG TPA: DUF1488 domain-containing protein [Rhizobium sp.]